MRFQRLSDIFMRQSNNFIRKKLKIKSKNNPTLTKKNISKKSAN